MKYATDCKYYKGDEPCTYTKLEGKSCSCEHYAKFGKRILIIKLGEMGDVIRTTPVLIKLKEEYPDSQITWITKTPELLPDLVDVPLKFDAENILFVSEQEFDLLFSFDKDKEACALAKRIKAKEKKGFTLLDNGLCYPMDKDANYKYDLGLDDDFNNKNKKSYPEQIFELAGYKFNKDEHNYLINNKFKRGKKLIGLNTGAGIRWSTRLWREEHWIKLTSKLIENGYGVLLLGGETEHPKNKRIARETNALYLGQHNVETFTALINLCDILVTTVTMALHIAIALNKKIVLFNNVFNKAEFELYGLGKVVEPKVDCLGCYKNSFDEDCPVPNCMDLITVETVLDAIEAIQK